MTTWAGLGLVGAALTVALPVSETRWSLSGVTTTVTESLAAEAKHPRQAPRPRGKWRLKGQQKKGYGELSLFLVGAVRPVTYQ